MRGWRKALSYAPFLWVLLHGVSGMFGLVYSVHARYPAGFYALLAAYFLALLALDGWMYAAPGGRQAPYLTAYWGYCAIVSALSLLPELLDALGLWVFPFWIFTPFFQLFPLCTRLMPRGDTGRCALTVLLLVSLTHLWYCRRLRRRGKRDQHGLR